MRTSKSRQFGRTNFGSPEPEMYLPNHFCSCVTLCADGAGGCWSAIRIIDPRSIFAISPTLRVGFFVILIRAFVIDTLINFLVWLPFALGTWQLRSRSPRMTDTELIEQSFQIAWSVLERTW